MEKSYADFMNEISADELYERLLAYGLFTDKLPPIFSSVDFYNYCQNKKATFSNKCKQYVYYENMRNINVPRSLAIPNPMAYQKLCRCLSDNWNNLRQHLEKQTSGQNYRISRIHIRKIKDSKALFNMNYDNWKTDGSPVPDLLIGKKYVVKTDISNCFPSIYTHSISWALVGKEDSKKNKQNEDEWYNKIDLYTRNCKDGETHGLLIGPHASNLLSELILTVVDKNMCEKHRDDGGLSYIRNIDDYTCYVDSVEKGQLFLTELGEELRKFDLSLNFKKTNIQKLPLASEEEWVRKIKSIYLLEKNGMLDYLGVRSYLDSAIDLMIQNKEDSSILNYAIKVLSRRELTQNARQYYIKTIFHLSLLYPYLIRLLEEYVFKPLRVECEQIQSFSNRAFNLGISTKNYEAICFSIYFSLKYNFEIYGLDADDAISNDSCLFKLFAYLYFDNHQNETEKKKLKNHARDLAKIDDDFERNWLFTYEALSQTDLKGDWKPMKKQGVSFIDKSFIKRD